MGLMDFFKEKDAYEGLWSRQVNDKVFLMNIKKEKEAFKVEFCFCWYEKVSEKIDGSENGRSRSIFSYKLKKEEIGSLFFALNNMTLSVAGLPIYIDIVEDKTVIMLKDSHSVFNYTKQKNEEWALEGLQTLIKEEILGSGMYKLSKDIISEDSQYIKILHQVNFNG